MSARLKSQIKHELLSRWALVPKDQWLDEFVTASSNLSHPLPALASTAHFRLLASDFTHSLATDPGQVFPQNVSDVNAKELLLSGDIAVQVLDIVDTGTSKWSQIEAIERVERGEEIRGREVIRNVPAMEDEDGQDANSLSGQAGPFRTPAGGESNQHDSSNKRGSTGPHKLLLQDAAGTKIWAFELNRIESITIVNSNPPLPGTDITGAQMRVDGFQIGCKLMLKGGAQVRRGMLMLSPASVTILGGKVELWDKKWRQSRKARLQRELEQENAT